MQRIIALLLLTTGAATAQGAVEGQRIYESLCAACHGVEARGDGPMAPVLDVLPPDLTVLARDNGGLFPAARVAARIDGRDPLLGHGGPMPLFGWFFDGEDVAVKTETGQPMFTSRGIVDVMAYLEEIQEN